MKRYLIALALLVGASSVAQAQSGGGGTVFNGISLNGLSLNGLTLNGTQENGIQFNGWNLNGLTLNGLTLNGTAAQGFDAQHSKTTDWSAVPLNQVQVRLPTAR